MIPCSADWEAGALYLDRKGRPLDMMEWAKLFEDEAYRAVRRTQVGQLVVSTIWEGITHAGGIFETAIIFGTNVRPIERYNTEEKALAGHERAVQRARFQL